MRINTPLTLSGCRRLIYGQLTDGKTHITTELEQDSESPQFLTRAMSAGHSAVGKDGKREGEEGVWESISRGQRNRSWAHGGHPAWLPHLTRVAWNWWQEDSSQQAHTWWTQLNNVPHIHIYIKAMNVTLFGGLCRCYLVKTGWTLQIVLQRVLIVEGIFRQMDTETPTQRRMPREDSSRDRM